MGWREGGVQEYDSDNPLLHQSKGRPGVLVHSNSGEIGLSRRERLSGGADRLTEDEVVRRRAGLWRSQLTVIRA